MPEVKQTFFKRGELDFKQILFQQINRTLEKLTEGDHIGFIDGVEGIYLMLFYYLDDTFEKEDKELFKDLSDEQNKIEGDLRLIDKDVSLTALGLHIAKKRLASLIKLAGRKRLLLQTRRIYDERTSEEPIEPSESELSAIVGSGVEEEQD